ncbi:MAG: T9SS type A sorting domain-containing protein, partial [Chitinophagales bacterium]
LNWTSKDVSAMKYEIERKIFGESNYTKIADVATQSNVSVLTNHSYQQEDTLINVQSGTVSYRIRQIVESAAATFTAAYIDTVDIILGSSCVTTGINPIDPNANKIGIFPNPAPGQFTLRIETFYPVNKLGIYIVDMRGQTVFEFNGSKSTGVASFNLPVLGLSKGKYIVAVYNGNELIASKKLIRL